MGSPQAAVSFLCTIFLAVFIFARRVREDVARLALVAWLLGSNFVHGVNAALWSSTVAFEGLGWCDVVTKLVLATTIAVPGACLCISYRLTVLSSSRQIPNGSIIIRNQRLLAALLCYLIPILYMPIHVIGQDHRFDLAKGIGCMASVHPSTPANLVVWMPQIAMCVFSLTCSGMAVHNYSSLTTVDFADHIKSRSPCMNTGLWLRTLVISATTTSVTLVLLVFSMFSSPMPDSWLSWAHVHQHLSEVNIMEQPSASIETWWWGLRSITLTYIIVAVAFGEETRDIVQYFSSLMRERFSNADLRALVPSHRKKDDPFHFSSEQAMELKSGWEDDFSVKSSKLSLKSWRKRKTSSSKSSSTRSKSMATEDSFSSPVSNFGSPLGSSLGYNTPILPPLPIHKSSSKKPKLHVDPYIIYEPPPSLSSRSSSTEPLVSNLHVHTASKASVITEVLEENWPSPPLTSPTPIPSGRSFVTGSVEAITPDRTSSLHDESYDRIYARPSPQLSRPFEEYTVLPPTFQPPPGLTPRAVSRRPSLRTLQTNLNGRNQPGRSQGDALIHMTIVHETV